MPRAALLAALAVLLILVVVAVVRGRSSRCASDVDCPPGQACTGGTCAAFAGCSPACAAPLVCVNKVCVAPSGTCDPACVPPQACVGGSCVTPAGACNPACVPPKVCQNGVCAATACSPPCTGAQVCLNGVCVDPPMQSCYDWVPIPAGQAPPAGAFPGKTRTIPAVTKGGNAYCYGWIDTYGIFQPTYSTVCAGSGNQPTQVRYLTRNPACTAAPATTNDPNRAVQVDGTPVCVIPNDATVGLPDQTLVPQHDTGSCILPPGGLFYQTTGLLFNDQIAV